MSIISKTFAACFAAASFCGASAIAAPYVSTETDIMGVNSEYDATLFTGRVGYEWDELESPVVPYVEIGGGVFTNTDGDSDGAFVVESGLSAEITENFDAFISVENIRVSDDNNWLVEFDLRYTF